MNKLALLFAAACAVCASASADMEVPRVEKGKLISPAPTPPSNTTYPRVDGPQGDRRLYLNKDVSVSGTVNPPSANVRLPYSKK